MTFGNLGKEKNYFLSPKFLSYSNIYYSTGEPVWAETTRIICQVILLFIFCVFLAFVLRQAIESPNVTQKIQESVSDVQVPGKIIITTMKWIIYTYISL